MRPAVGSVLWLLAFELRLAWRRPRGKNAVWRLALIMGLFCLGGALAAEGLRRVTVPVTPTTALFAIGVCVVVFTLMLSQTLATATETLYSRGDLDLMFSSPVDPGKVLMARFSAVAAKVFLAFALLVTPFLLPAGLLGHPAWLAGYLVLGAEALAASAVGLVLATALFRLIGPRRTRAAAQVLAAVIGAAFFLISQARNLLGRAQTDAWVATVIRAAHGHALPEAATWPLRAALGQPAPLAVLLTAGAGVFAAATYWLGRRFAADAAAASGAAVARPTRAKTARVFARGAFAATLRKELRLMVRDVAAMSQVLLRAFYLVPVLFVVMRNAGLGHAWAVPAGVSAVTFVAGQVAASLTWITFFAEDSPELIASAPASLAVIWRAKLIAGLAPLAAVLALPLLALLALAPQAGLAALVFWSAAAIASGLISQWRQRPTKRSEFRRRSAGSILIVLAQLAIGLLLGAGAGLAASPSPWAMAAAAVLLIMAGLALLLMRRSEAEIMAGLVGQGA